MKIFLIAPNTNHPFDAVRFHGFIHGLYPMLITSWWNYIPGTMYLVKTNLEVNQLDSLIKQHMGALQYVVIEVNPKSSQG